MAFRKKPTGRRRQKLGYFTIKNEAVSQFEEKKSIFIGHAARICSETEAKNYIDSVKSRHKEAKHNVYAYVIGENMGIQRYSDDGEPQGTAGMPVLDVIKKAGITDIAIVVTRYFGGVLLGKGGLVRAYTKAASLAVKAAGIVEIIEGAEVEIDLEYEGLGKLRYLFEQNGWFIEKINYTDKVKAVSYFEIKRIPEIKKKIMEALNGRCTINEGPKELFFKDENGKLNLKS